MRKNIIVTLVIIIFTLYINLGFLWSEDNRGFNEFVMFLLGILFFFFLVLIQISLLIDLKKDYIFKKGILICINFVCLILIFLFPNGIYYPKEKRTLYLIADYEGVVNCSTHLYLFENKEFKEANFCFGTTTTKGTYKISNDSIYFFVNSLAKNKKEYFKYAIIDSSRNKITRFYKNDSINRAKLTIRKIPSK